MMNFKTCFDQKGYVVAPQLLAESQLEAMRNCIAGFVGCLDGGVDSGVDIGTVNNDKDTILHQRIKQLKLRSHEDFLNVVDQIIPSLAYKNIIYSPVVIELVCHLLNAKPEHLVFTNEHVRVDLPIEVSPENAKKQHLEWHQESSYFKDYCSSSQGVVVWIPLFDCKAENGCMELIEGSHALGNVEHQGHYELPEEKRHFRLVIPSIENILASHARSYAEAKAGDIVVNHFQTIHRSGKNTSDRVRYTLLVRVSNMAAADYQFPHKATA